MSIGPAALSGEVVGAGVAAVAMPRRRKCPADGAGVECCGEAAAFNDAGDAVAGHAAIECVTAGDMRAMCP